ncbi:MAG: EamA family transporter [Alphaproteobacteria bacterium]|nr:EamA family transporter [Alphaproteobacteria bacterium]
MTLLVTALLLLAALIHASWNAFIKGARDPVAMATLIYGTEALIMLPVLFFVGPLPQSVWLLTAVHVALHIVYKIALIAMFQHGDLSQVYPVARGVAPLLVTALAIPAAGEIPGAMALLGIGLICAGLLSFALERSAIGRARTKPLLLAATAGIALSAYTVIDGLGVRTPGAALSYAAWLFVLDGSTMFVIARIWRGPRLYTSLRLHWKTGTALGLISSSNFCIVLWALSFAAMGPVAAVRETSVVFAALIGAIFMGESFGIRRVAAAVVIAAGIVLMNV